MKILIKNEVKLLLQNNPLHGVNRGEKGYLTLNEAFNELKFRPKPKFLWNGIKEKSMGLVFGPSKSGKTIFCENLALHLAMGAQGFMGYPLEGRPKKVLFVGLEEYWEERVRRNMAQYVSLSQDQKQLVSDNYMIQPFDFTKKVTTRKNWEDLERTIVKSKAEVVIIDSITRMNSSKLEDSAEAERIMQKLRDMCHRLRITMICIHHTPKIGDEPLTMDTIKGSSVFSQESDFAVGVRKTRNNSRYIKNVFCRYGPDDDEMVNEFIIDGRTRISLVGGIEEDDILKKIDRRREIGKRDIIINYLNDNPTSTFKSAFLVNHFTELLGIKERQIKEYLSELVKENKIKNPKKGHYTSILNGKDGMVTKPLPGTDMDK